MNGIIASNELYYYIKMLLYNNKQCSGKKTNNELICF